MKPREENFEQREFRQTFIPDISSIRCGDLKIQVNFYPLTESQFDKLVGHGGGLKDWSNNFLIAGFGVCLVVLAKVIAFLFNYSNTEIRDGISLGVACYEWISLGLAFGLSAVFHAFSWFFKNKKDRLIADIQKFFNTGKNV